MKIFKKITALLIPITLGLFLFLVIDFIFGNSLLKIVDPKILFRTPHSEYHHTFNPDIDGVDKWGDRNHRLCTNNYAFKSECDKLENESKEFDIAFIGDSYVEGIGLPYEETFVGMLKNAHPELRIANLGAGSYSPTIYLQKVKSLLNEGFKFKELVVYIDISDIQDEALSYELKDGSVVGPGENPKYRNFKLKIKNLFPITYYGMYKLGQMIHPALNDHSLFYKKEYRRSGWTYDNSNEGFGKLGLEKSISKARNAMIELYDLAHKNNMKFSVGVYPWPGQILFDQAESEQVKIWRNFCRNRCNHFYNSFPQFFNIEKTYGKEFVIKNYFIENDTHYNKAGNEILFKTYINGAEW